MRRRNIDSEKKSKHELATEDEEEDQNKEVEHSESDDEREISCEDIGNMETVDEVCDDDVLPEGIENYNSEEEDTDEDVDEQDDHNNDDDPDEVGDADADEEVQHHLVSA